METTETLEAEVIAKHFEPAPVGLLFVNYLMDVILFGILYVFVLFFSFIAAYLLFGSAAVEELYNSVDGLSGKLLSYLFFYVLFISFHGLIEGSSKGRSLGKMITGTIAIQENGHSITWKDAFLRSLCRCIPFNELSCFSRFPWHDRISNTVVVRKQDLVLNNFQR